ncbi:MAG: IS110 family transposase [Burkholderiaceae bacterium]
MRIARVGVDIAKNAFHLNAVDSQDQKVWSVKLKRGQWLSTLSTKADTGVEVGLEACASAHHWARELSARGFKVKLMAAQFVKPYVKSNKNDEIDAQAICEAMSRPTMRFVRPKSIVQQDVQATHRIRTELVTQRTAKVNHIRGLVGEYGLVAPVGINQLRRALPCWLEDAENGLSGAFRELLQGLWADLIQLDERVAQLDERINNLVKQDPVAKRLSQLRGVGPITVTALSVALGDASGFKNGREFAVSLGLTPKLFCDNYTVWTH